MKLMIASDIHGSAFYCNKLINRFYEEKPDRLLLLGDILYHGPRNDLPEEYNAKSVIQMLNEIKDNIICVRGNCDSEVDQMVLEFALFSDYTTILLEDRMIFATHGHRYCRENLPNLRKGDIFLQGHTHVPVCDNYGSYIHMNPGSVSIPKNGSVHGYMSYENGVFEWKDLNGEAWKRFDLAAVR